MVRAARVAGLVLIGLSITVLPPFLAAGRIDWVNGWIWIGITFVGLALVRVHVGRHNPDLPKRRSRVGAGTPVWDLVLINLLRLSIIGVLIVGGLDAGRYGWAPLPVWAQVAGALIMGLGLYFSGAAMGANEFFEATVRIQDDAGHHVVDRGPYRFVRHPGYAGITLMVPATALVLGSAWALVPAAAGVVTMVIRTALEDRFLHHRLAGYTDYSARVRYRLVPNIW